MKEIFAVKVVFSCRSSYSDKPFFNYLIKSLAKNTSFFTWHELNALALPNAEAVASYQ